MKIKLIKFLMIFAGIISLILGILGIFLPILPTTPFLLLSAFLFIKSSQKLYNWLINHKVFGEHIYNYRTYKAIKLRTKIVSIIVLWVTISLSIYFVDILWVRIMLLCVAVGVTIHLSLIKTLENLKK